MFERIKTFFSTAKEATQIVYSSGTRGVWGATGQMIKNPGAWLKWFKISPRLKAVDKIANDIGAIDILHTDNDGNKYDKSEAIELLNIPNNLPEFTKFQLMRLTEIHYKILGEAFWIIGKGANGKPESILPIPPHWVESIPRKEMDKSYKVRTSNGEIYFVPKEDMVYFKRVDAYEPFKRGVGDSQQIGDELQIDEAMAKYQNLTFKNGAMPPVVIGLKGASGEERKRFKNAWRREFSGISKSHGVATVDADAISVNILKQTMRDLDYVNSRKFIQDLTLEHYMIPKELIGKVENSNRSTITQAQLIYEKNVLKPDIMVLQDVLNRQYLPMFGVDGKIVFDNYITSDSEFNKEKAKDGYDSGILTRNEARVLMGFDEVVGGDVYKSKLGEVLISQEENNTEPAKAEPQPKMSMKQIVFRTNAKIIGKIGKIKNLTNDQKVYIWTKLDNAAQANEDGAERLIKKFMQRQQNDLTDLVMGYFEESKAIPSDLENEMNEFFEQENENLNDELKPIWLNSAKMGYETANEIFDLGISWDITRPEWEIMIEEFGLEEATKINNTTKEALKKEIIEGINEGESIPRIRDRVSEVYANAKGYRATMIARTETHMATVGGTKATYKAAGITKNEWLTTIDGRERDWHGSMNGQIVGIDEKFESGLGNMLSFPGDPTAPASDVVQCRCVLLPIFE